MSLKPSKMSMKIKVQNPGMHAWADSKYFDFLENFGASTIAQKKTKI